MDIESSLVTLTQARARRISEAIRANEIGAAIYILIDLDAADVAAVFNELHAKDRDQLVHQALRSLNPEFLLDLDENVREQLLNKITTISLAEALSHMETNDAISIIEGMSSEQQKILLNSFQSNTRKIIETALNYPEDSVGRIAETCYLALPGTWNITKTRAILTSWQGSAPYIILLDKHSKPDSALHIARFAMYSDENTLCLQDMQTESLYKILYDTNKEDASFLFRRYKLQVAAVIDRHDKLVGILTPESLLQVEHERAEEELLNLTGATESDYGLHFYTIAFNRVRWLILTIIGCLFVSILQSMFMHVWKVYEPFIIILPMISAIGGAAITQTGGATMHLLINRQISITNINKLLRKEFLVSCVTGLILGVIIFIRYLTLTQACENLIVGFIGSVSIMLLVIWAGFAGIFLPFVAYKIGLDPATTIYPVLSMTTDTVAIMLLFTLSKCLLGL